MSKAEEIHYKAIIAADNQEPPKDYAISAHADHFNGFVEGFVEGYHQAEEDLALTWEDLKLLQDLSHEVFAEVVKGSVDFYQIYPTEQSYLEEVLKRFKDLKK